MSSAWKRVRTWHNWYEKVLNTTAWTKIWTSQKNVQSAYVYVVYLNGYRDTECLVWTVMVCSVFVECCDVRVKFDLKLLGLWPKLPLKESINVKEGHSTTLSFSDEEKADVIVSETFGVLLLQDSGNTHSMVVFCTVDVTMFFFFSEMFLRNVALTNFPKISMSFICQFTVYISVCWIPRTLGRSWRPGGMPWVFCPCQWAPCQAEADRVPRALRWCADAAALEFQSIAWCHGRLSSRRIQALGMLEGHRTMFNMFNHIWWSFLNSTVFS